MIKKIRYWVKFNKLKYCIQIMFNKLITNNKNKIVTKVFFLLKNINIILKIF